MDDSGLRRAFFIYYALCYTHLTRFDTPSRTPSHLSPSSARPSLSARLRVHIYLPLAEAALSSLVTPRSSVMTRLSPFVTSHCFFATPRYIPLSSLSNALHYMTSASPPCSFIARS